MHKRSVTSRSLNALLQVGAILVGRVARACTCAAETGRVRVRSFSSPKRKL